VRKLIENYLLRKGISLDSIQHMLDEDVNEYYVINNVLDEIEAEQMNQGR
jgi:hypothetical protein